MSFQMTTGEKIFQVFNYVCIAALCMSMIYPFLHVISVSLTPAHVVLGPGIRLYPPEFTLDAYRAAFQDPLVWYGFANSIGRTVAGTVLSLIIMSMGAYAISKKYFPDRIFWTMFMFWTMFFSGGLIPTYLLMRTIGLVDSYLVYILPPLISTFSLIILRSFFMNLPSEIEESAKMDGAHDISVLVRIVIPMSKPVLATLALWHAVTHWNAWFDALIYIQSEQKQVLQLYLRKIIISAERMRLDRLMSGHSSEIVNNDNVKAAVLMISTVPILIVYPFLQKYFARGIMIGSIKG